MRSGTIAFLAGVVLLQQWARLPSIHWCWLLPLALLGLRSGPLRLPAALLAGWLWALLWGSLGLAGDLPPGCEGVDLEARGVVVSIPQRSAFGHRALVRIEQLPECPDVRLPLLARIGWYSDPAELAAGQEWRLRLRLKRRNGLLNPGGFDYEGWLFQHGIEAVGYVRTSPTNGVVGFAGDLQARWAALRQTLYGHVSVASAGAAHQGVLLALTLGERGEIPRAQWDVFIRTGTGHLLAISGLHVALVAGLGLIGGSWLWRHSARLCTWLPARQAGMTMGLALATVYAALSGFALPTQRAIVMLAVAAGAMLMRREVASSRVLAAALLAVLVADPLAVLAPAFWLSYGAVAILIFGMSHRLAPRGWWWRWGRAQWLVGIGLLPMTLGLFQQAPLIGPLANLVAVPWVGLLVTPLALLGMVLAPLSNTLAGWSLGAADLLVALLWPLMQGLAGAEHGLWRSGPGSLAVALGGLGAALALTPRGLPGRAMAVPLLLPLAWGATPGAAPGIMELRLLDVGQGLAAVVQVGTRVLVYDTGPRYSEGFDAGRGVVAPFLRTLGVRRIDRLIVSHGDNDHSGGYRALAAQFAVADVLSGEPQAIGPEARPCERGQSWRWGEVGFAILHPPGQIPGLSANDHSCVLRIDSPGGSVLLTGDLQRAGEALVLAAGDAPGVRADVLVAPHHGSATSSTPPFVAAVQPRWVLYAIGYRNRFGFPRPEVSARYAAQGAQGVDTASCGAVRVRFEAGAAPQVQCYREAAGRYWNRR